MTRQEFVDDVDNYDRLMEVASDNGYDFENVYSEDSYDSEINDQLSNSDSNWTDIRDWLTGLPEGYDFYVQDRWGDWEGRYYEDIDDLKEQFLEWADEYGIFDDDEEESEEDEEPDEVDAELEESECEFTVDDLLAIVWDSASRSA